MALRDGENCDDQGSATAYACIATGEISEMPASPDALLNEENERASQAASSPSGLVVVALAGGLPLPHLLGSGTRSEGSEWHLVTLHFFIEHIARS